MLVVLCAVVAVQALMCFSLLVWSIDCLLLELGVQPYAVAAVLRNVS